MQPIYQPQEHELYHDRQYPPYGPTPQLDEREYGRGPLPYLMLAVLAVLGLWAFTNLDDGIGRMDAVQMSSKSLFEPSQAAELYREPSRGVSLTEELAESTEPLDPSPLEQQLSRSLAELDTEMGRTARLAKRMGQGQAYSTLEKKHDILEQAVAQRPTPWTERDRAELSKRAAQLKRELAKFSSELEEVASVQL